MGHIDRLQVDHDWAVSGMEQLKLDLERETNSNLLLRTNFDRTNKELHQVSVDNELLSSEARKYKVDLDHAMADVNQLEAECERANAEMRRLQVQCDLSAIDARNVKVQYELVFEDATNLEEVRNRQAQRLMEVELSLTDVQ